MAAKKKCFVISPIGEEGTQERAEADWFLEIVNGALSSEFEVKRGDDYVKTDLITNQVIQAIESADLIVADLTNHNPNVHYELGVAHAQRKHVVPMIAKGQRLPFDNMPVRTIFYSRIHPRDMREAVNTLKEVAAHELAGKVHNPVTLALGIQELKASPDDRDQVIATLSDRITALSAQVDALTQPTAPKAPRYHLGRIGANGELVTTNSADVFRLDQIDWTDPAITVVAKAKPKAKGREEKND